MHRHFAQRAARLLPALILSCAAALSHADDWRISRQTRASFADTRDAIVAAIENRGLVINYTAHIADMLERTGRDLGAGQRLFEHAEIIEFCSAGLSRKMMEADPHHIVFCPFSMAVYTLPDQPGTTWISYRRPQGKAAPLVTPLLEAIAQEGLNGQ